MAKAKKEQTTESPKPSAAAAKPARKAAAKATAGAAASKPAAKAARKSAKPAAPAGAPLIDTNLAAQAAAKMLVNRDLLNRPDTTEKRESSSFKQLKESLAKPPAQGPASFLQSTAPQKKLNLPFGGRNQVGHNQTFGADVNRTGVPRRTGG
ncbi:MAG TPA: hypothetical protein VN541_00260 [Tepidisphaeraceae bacterium]|nr:hypothetical protein [Tepidisphaeraceae bacterium]